MEYLLPQSLYRISCPLISKRMNTLLICIHTCVCAFTLCTVLRIYILLIFRATHLYQQLVSTIIILYITMGHTYRVSIYGHQGGSKQSDEVRGTHLVLWLMINHPIASTVPRVIHTHCSCATFSDDQDRLVHSYDTLLLLFKTKYKFLGSVETSMQWVGRR